MLNLPLVQGIAALRIVGTDEYIERLDRPRCRQPVSRSRSTTARSAATSRRRPVAQRFSDSNWETLRGGRASLLVQPTDA